MQQPFSQNEIIDIAKKAIEEIKCLNFDTISFEEIDLLLRKIYWNRRSNAVFLNPGPLFYRGIKYSTKPQKVDQIIYPPKYLAKMGRANDLGEQLFYCSSHKKTPFYELFATPGERMVISTWQNVAMPFIHILGYKNTELTNLLNAYDPHNTGVVVPDLNREIDILTAEFIQEFFCKKIDENFPSYKKLTIAIARSHYNIKLNWNQNKKIEVDGILYPTIQLDMLSENFAFMPHMIDDKYLSFCKVEYIEVIRVENEHYVYKILDFADRLKTNDILWNHSNKTWTVNDKIDDICFIENGGNYDAFTIDGELIPSDE